MFVYSFVVKRFVCLAVQGNTPLLVGKYTTIKTSLFLPRRYFIQYDVMIFLIIWPLLIHSSQQPSNLRDNSTHVCRIFSLVIPCIFGLFVDNFHLVLYMKRSLSWHFSKVEARYSKIGRLDSHWSCLFSRRNTISIECFWWHYVLPIYCLIHIYRGDLDCME